MPTIKTYQDPKYPTNTVYISTSDFGKAMYMSGPKVFVVYDQRDNIICRLDYDIAVNIAAIFTQLTLPEKEAQLAKYKMALELACQFSTDPEETMNMWLEQVAREE